MTIDALIKVVPPPIVPLEAFAGPWEPVEAYLGTRLPQDYKDFARLYGNGLFMDFLSVHVSALEEPYGGFKDAMPRARRMFSDTEVLPYRLWPDPGGLIYFGNTDYGDQLYWLPQGAPDNWKVVFWDHGLGILGPFEEFDCGVAEFLAGLASGTIVPKGYRKEDLEPYEPMFQPVSFLEDR